MRPGYNAASDEVWFSVWNGTRPGSAIVVVDDRALTRNAVIDDERIITPNGRFNVHNTVGDIY